MEVYRKAKIKKAQVQLYVKALLIVFFSFIGLVYYELLLLGYMVSKLYTLKLRTICMKQWRKHFNLQWKT